MALSRTMNRFTLLATAIAGIVGSGWLLSPFAAAKIAGPAATISWLVAGLLMMVVAYTFIVITRHLPIAGGTVRFFQISHGHFVGFTFSWIAWLAWVAVAPIETMALLQYAATYQPWIMRRAADGSSIISWAGFALGSLLLMSIFLVNRMGVKALNKANYAMVFLKLAIPVATAVVLLSHHFNWQNVSGPHGFMPMGIQSIFTAMPLAGVIYAFIGFNPAIQLAAEVKDPKRSIRFAIMGALFCCIVLYVAIQLAFIGSLNPQSFQQGWSKLSFLGDTGPFAGVMTALGFVFFVKLLYADAIISPYGSAMVQSAATSRLTYAMSLNGYFPAWLQALNHHKTPMRALLFNTLLGLLFFLPFPSWQRMVGFLVSCLVMGYVVGPMSLMAIRLPENIHDPLVGTHRSQALCLTAFYICNLMILWTGWVTVQKVGIAFSLGYILLLGHHLFVAKSPKMKLDIHRGWWVIPYLTGLVVFSKYSSFHGGSGLIPFGWDLLVMLAFTVVIFICAHKTVQRFSRNQQTIEFKELST